MSEQRQFWLTIIGGLLLIALMGGGGYVTYRHFKQRGIRNNNPGNLRITADAWRGKVPKAENTDGSFEQFRDTDGVPGHVWGLRAMFKDLRGDIVKDGKNTVRKLITEYAPPSENNTAAYIASVAKALGIGPDAEIQPSHYPVLMAAIVQHENGIQPYPAADIQRAIALA